jgi:hypothetical protein
MKTASMAKGGLASLFAIGVLATSAPGAAQPAGMALRLDNAQLVSRSDVVVYGRVAAVKAGGTTSEALVAVDCALKGAPGKELTVTFSPGLGGSAVFEPGEVVLLFLTQTRPGRFQTTGGEQGKFAFPAARPAGQPGSR